MKKIHLKPGIVALLDIGDAKVVCFIAQIDHEGDLRIIGIGHQVSKGMKSGVITDVNDMEASIVAAVHAAEQMAGETIEEVMVSLSGVQLSSRTLTVEMQVAPSGVTERDMTQLVKEGSQSILTEDYEMVHCIPLNFSLDDTRGIRDPRGLFGKKLGAEIHVVLASSSLLRNISHCIARCHLNIKRFVVAPYAAGLACLEPDEMELGVTLIDVGSGVSSVAVFIEGKLHYVDAVPLGGSHVTSDIAKGISTSIGNAERIKTLHGSVVASHSDSQAMVEVPQLGEEEHSESSQIPRSMLTGIIRPRVEEIFEILRGRLEAAGVDKMAGRCVVITGGGSQMSGIRELATEVLGKQVRIGRPVDVAGVAEAVSGPAFSAPIGMLQCINRRVVELEVANHDVGLASTSPIFRLFNWIRESF